MIATCIIAMQPPCGGSTNWGFRPRSEVCMTRTSLSQLSHGDAPTPAALTRRVPRRRVLGMVVALVVTVATVGTPALAAKPNKPSRAPTTMLPLTITGVAVRDGQLVAQGTLGKNPFEAPLTLVPTGDTSA